MQKPSIDSVAAVRRLLLRVRMTPCNCLHVLASVLFLIGAEASIAAQPQDHQENLLKDNPSFEAGPFGAGHGEYAFPGWSGSNYRFGGNYVDGGDATDGHSCFHINWGGRLATAPPSRPAVTPGVVYEMRFDIRTLIGRWPDEWLGTTPYLDFFDAKGNRVKSYWGPDWLPQVQPRGVAPWQEFEVRGVAPVGAATAGVRIDAPSGVFHDPAHAYEDNRDVEVDNFKLYRVGEAADRLAIRRYPKLVEPGKPATLSVIFAATAPRKLSVRLLRSTGDTVAQSDGEAPIGRGMLTVALPLPDTLKDGDYSWSIQLLDPSGGARPTAQLSLDNVFCDQSVTLPASGAFVIDADNSDIVRMGRWDVSDPKHPEMIWFASEIRLRFNGTSLTLHASASNDGYGGPQSIPLTIVIDGDESNLTTVNVNAFDGRFPLAKGLKDAVHTAVIFKANESDQTIRFDGVELDPGRGLLRPEPLPTRKIEIYGDSVTSGGSAEPNYFAYAPLLGRTLDADVHVISKGGTGVSASFSNMVTLRSYWNRLTFRNVWDASKEKPWNFAQWTPDAVLIAIGHNDQFNNGREHFAEHYKEFVGDLRKVYPQTPIFCTNTLISGDPAFYGSAISPIVEQYKRVYFGFQRASWTDPATGHPPTAAHAAMVNGDADRFSYADWIEDHVGWGIGDKPSLQCTQPSPTAEPTHPNGPRRE
jgi:lysophospholipase L1-like esterase